jgi:hypothetical protein
MAGKRHPAARPRAGQTIRSWSAQALLGDPRGENQDAPPEWTVVVPSVGKRPRDFFDKRRIDSSVAIKRRYAANITHGFSRCSTQGIARAGRTLALSILKLKS